MPRFVGHDLRFEGRCARVPVIGSGQIPVLLHILRPAGCCLAVSRCLSTECAASFTAPIDWASF